MYFKYLPNVSLAERPIKFPWSEQQYITAKNIFRKFTISNTAFDTAVYFKKYTIKDSDRPDLVSQQLYGDSGLDWIVLLCNNIINPYFDWPMPTPVLQDYIDKKYDQPYAIKYYLTNEVKNSAGDVVLPKDQIVDEGFYKAPYYIEFNDINDKFPAEAVEDQTWVDEDGNHFRYKGSRQSGDGQGGAGTQTAGWEKLVRDSFRYRDPDGSIVTLSGNSIVRQVTYHQYETEKNDAKRTIYILKDRYLMQFVDEMKKQLPYKKSSDYVSGYLKRSAV